MSSKIGPKLSSQILSLREGKKTYKEICALLGVSQNTIIRYLHPDRYLNPLFVGRKVERHNAFRRQKRLSSTVNGVRGFFKVNKRPMPNSCELCNGVPSRLHWHH